MRWRRRETAPTPRPTLPVAVCLLFISAVASSAIAQSVMLEWLWQDGQRLTYEITEEMDQRTSSEAMGERAEQRLRDVRTWTFEQSVLDVSGEGVATIERTYTRLRMRHRDAEGKKIAYDSDRPGGTGGDHPRIRPFADFVGRSITFKVDRTGGVLESQGGAALMRALTESVSSSSPLGGSMPAGLGGGIDYEDMVRRQIEQGLRIVPGRSVRRGDRWDASGEQPVPMLGAVHLHQTHRFAGTKRRGSDVLVRIETLGRMQLPDRHPLAGILQLSLDGSEIEAESLLDIETGTLVESTASAETRMRGSSDVLGERLSFEQHIEQKATLKLISGR